MRGRSSKSSADTCDARVAERSEMRWEQFVGDEDRPARWYGHGGIGADEQRDHLALDVLQVSNALDQQPVAGGADRLGVAADRAAPGKGGALALGDQARAAASSSGSSIRARCAAAMSAPGPWPVSAVASNRSRALARAVLFRRRATTLFRHGNIGGSELEGRADRETGRGTDAVDQTIGGGWRDRRDRLVGFLTHALFDQASDGGDGGTGIGAAPGDLDLIVMADTRRQQRDDAARIGGLAVGGERYLGREHHRVAGADDIEIFAELASTPSAACGTISASGCSRDVQPDADILARQQANLPLPMVARAVIVPVPAIDRVVDEGELALLARRFAAVAGHGDVGIDRPCGPRPLDLARDRVSLGLKVT